MNLGEIADLLGVINVLLNLKQLNNTQLLNKIIADNHQVEHDILNELQKIQEKLDEIQRTNKEVH